MSLFQDLAAGVGRIFAPKQATAALPAIIRGSELFDVLTDGSLGGLPTPTAQTAWTLSAVSACVSLISGAISALPIEVYKRNKEGNRTRVPNDPLWWMFNEEMSARWSSAAGWQAILESRLLHGDGFAEILRDQNGTPKGLVPLLRERVTPVVTPDGSRLVYVIDPDPTILNSQQNIRRVVDQDDMIHISGEGFDGRVTPSPLRNQLRMSGSVALATQEFSAQFFANSARPDYVLQTDNKLSADAIDNIRAKLLERHQGPKNRALPLVLQQGLKVQTLNMPMDDLQLIQQRQFQIEEIARAYGVPPFMIGHTEKTTSWGSGVETMGANFVRYVLNRHIEKIQTELNRKIFRTYAKFAAFDTFGLERADMKSLFESFRTAIGRAGEPGFLTVDEVRGYINFGPVTGGSEINPGTVNAPAPPA